MPDWLAHVLFAYILCSVLGLKFKVFNKENTAVVMIGALVPDLVKVGLVFDFLGMYVGDFIYLLHTPVGSLLVAGTASLLFSESVFVFGFLILGVTTHFMLDLLLGHVSGGMLLFFPVSWDKYQLGLIHSDDFRITVLMIVVAAIVYPEFDS
jgi:hypothetical protein